MRGSDDMEQLTLDLFGDERRRPEPLEEFTEWARSLGCPKEVEGVARRLFAEMPDARDRGKALAQVTRNRGFDRQAVDALGLFDRGIDYHVCWDRAWAFVCGMDVAHVGEVMRCDPRTYSTRPSFYDGNGNHIGTLVSALMAEGSLERMEKARAYGRKKDKIIKEGQWRTRTTISS